MMNIKLSIFFLFFSVFLIFGSGHFGGDGLEDYFVAESIVLDQDLAIYDRPFNVSQMNPHEKDIATGEAFYSKRDLGLPLMLVPFYSLGHFVSSFFPDHLHDYIAQFFVSLFNPFCCALLVVVLFSLIRELGYSACIAYAAVSIFSFCTMTMGYVKSGFSEIATALCVVSALLYLFRYQDHASPKSLFLAGIALAWALFIKKANVIILPVIMIWFLIIETRAKKSFSRVFVRESILVLPIFVAIAAMILKNKFLYGSVLKTEYGAWGDLADKASSGKHYLKAVFYYLLSSGKGYFLFNPPLILGFFALNKIFTKHRAKTALLVLIVATIFGFYVNIFTRGSLFSWGPRYLFLTMPLVTVFLAEFIAQAHTGIRRAWIYLAAGFGFLANLPVYFINPSKFLFFLKEKLAIDEYMINFIPDLSPLRGAWTLLISAVRRLLMNASNNFVFSPDKRLGIVDRIASLNGYDVLDCWWSNILRIDQGFVIFVFIGLSVIACVAILSLISVRRGIHLLDQ